LIANYEITIEPEKGGQYFFESDCNEWVCWLQQFSEEKFKSAGYVYRERTFKNKKYGCPDLRQVGF
jgi:hypothetical protein